MNATELLELSRIVLSLSVLAVSSYCDYRERRVPNVMFTIFFPAAAGLTLVEILLSPNVSIQLLTFTVYGALTFVLFYAVYWIGLFGGADAKLMMGLSLAAPWPFTTITPIYRLVLPIFPISILNNSLIAAVITFPYAVLANVAWKTRTGLGLFAGLEEESPVKKIGAILFCIKKEKSQVKAYDIIAEKDGKIQLFRSVPEDDLSLEELQSLPENVFVSFSLPLVIFITIGFVVAIFLGDLIFLLSNALFHYT